MFVKVYFPEGRLVHNEATVDRNDKMIGNHCNHRSRSEKIGSHLLFQQIEFDGVSGGAIVVVMRRGMLGCRSLPATAGMPVCNCRRLVGLTMTDHEEVADKGDQQQKGLSLYRLETGHG
jgi:acyl CoA:acetate/3-ketoacid CoA transferase alpha subunit